MSLADFAVEVAQAYQDACLAELSALKPGNVHIFADGHGMVVKDFILSAEVSASVMAQLDIGVGQRIKAAVQATWQSVNCNTNLGIILLAAPMIQASLLAYTDGMHLSLRESLAKVLQNLSLEDAVLAYQAVEQASPAGLGNADEHDIHAQPTVTLLSAMQAAEQRDLIARQYSNGFTDIFDVGLAQYESAIARWNNESWAVSAVHLAFMAGFPDSHIVRKYGASKGAEIQQRAAEYLYGLLEQENPKLYQRALLEFDAALKAERINPGTSADLTVATVLASYLQNVLKQA
ncbi:triphosphoribosyl-dephospho-CoA synthase [Methyloradius palustris]|uniref:Triphosphoribosyl-dephospho-CoA synthase n=1 Tax=Methyloradius palustris TaxID=2778876 RepID=A0A8D5JYQ2_9PROT|nr:triphosphoribosyl-dephospho-CoA synthase [Methyloradius palustris]BCM24927.1 triphosphoribosyl-dephospho-CoA synthase [Methyloradius palustris]